MIAIWESYLCRRWRNQHSLFSILQLSKNVAAIETLEGRKIFGFDFSGFEGKKIQNIMLDIKLQKVFVQTDKNKSWVVIKVLLKPFLHLW